MNRRTTSALTALCLGLALTACSGEGDDDPSVTVPSATATSGPAAAGEFSSTAELAAALNTDGLTCTELRTGEFPGVSEAQSCILNESEDVVLLVFASAAEQTDYLANKDALASAVVGDGWAVQTVLPESAQAVADVIGGEVVAGEQAAG
jgi:hypothetical protein